MLIKRARVYWIVAAVFGLAISLTIAWAISRFYSSFDSPHINSGNEASKSGETYIIQQPEDWGSPLVIVSAFLCLITLGLAFYTRGLFRETANLARDTRKASAAALTASTEATNLARDEFNATHRPKIIVHWVELGYTTNIETTNASPTISATVLCFNVGDTDATIVELRGNIQIRSAPLRAGIVLPNILDEQITIRAGQRSFLSIGSDLGNNALRFAAQRGEPVLCIATIIYEDAAKVRRQTGLCWEYTLTTGEGRWDKYESPDGKMYDYAY